jgi:hypothetical protein
MPALPLNTKTEFRRHARPGFLLQYTPLEQANRAAMRGEPTCERRFTK